MPDYANGISITVESMTGWTAPEDGYIYLECKSNTNETVRVYIDGKPVMLIDGTGEHYGYCFAPMRRGSSITTTGGFVWRQKYFYPLI